MRYFQIFVVAALAVSLIMNYSLFSRIDRLESHLHSVSNDQFDLRNAIYSQADHIQTVMNDIREEQSWISPINVDVDSSASTTGNVFLTFEWQIKELPQDQPVVEFHYRLGDSEDFQTVTADEVGNGFFRVKVHFEMDLEPSWYVSRSYSHGSQTSAEGEARDHRYKEGDLNYFVSMSHGGVLKSGNRQFTNLEHYSQRVYGEVFTNIHFFNDDVSIDVSGGGDYYETQTSLKNVYLLAYLDGELQEEREMQTDEAGEEEYWPKHFWLGQPLKEDSFNQLVIRLVYSDGKTFEKEVHPR